jgi:hypothetical protein
MMKSPSWMSSRFCGFGSEALIHGESVSVSHFHYGINFTNSVAIERNNFSKFKSNFEQQNPPFRQSSDHRNGG